MKTKPKSAEYKAFENLLGSVLSVSKAELNRRIAQEKSEKRAPSPNTVHLSILMASRILILGNGLLCRGRSGKLLILRLTPRKLRRLRLETTRSSSISPSTAL